MGEDPNLGNDPGTFDETTGLYTTDSASPAPDATPATVCSPDTDDPNAYYNNPISATYMKLEISPLTIAVEDTLNLKFTALKRHRGKNK